MNKQFNLNTLAKILIVIVFLPFAAIWYVWKKTEWSNRNKWLATTGIVVFCLFALATSGEDQKVDPNQQAEIAKLNAEVETLKQQLEERKTENEQVQPSELAEGLQLADEPVQEGEVIKVTHVVDGDTIKLENGQVIRYIGIDTPETVDPRKPVQCFGKEASAKNRELVEGKEVRLMKDTSETDKYGRLLRYVYVGDTFVNDYLVRNGYAHSSSYPPDVKYQDQFRAAEQEAKENKRGLWADDACKTETSPEPTATQTSTTVIPVPVPVTSGSSNSYTCNCSKTCSQMGCDEAQYQLDVCGCSKRDADKDGIACDSNCQ